MKATLKWHDAKRIQPDSSRTVMVSDGNYVNIANYSNGWYGQRWLSVSKTGEPWVDDIRYWIDIDETIKGSPSK